MTSELKKKKKKAKKKHRLIQEYINRVPENSTILISF